MDEQKLTPARLITLLGPVFAIVAGACTTWLVQHFPGLHLDEAALSVQIASILAGIVTMVIAWALQHKFLVGQQKWEAYIADPHSDIGPDGKPGNAWHPADDPFVPPVEDENMGAAEAPGVGPVGEGQEFPDARVRPDKP